LRRSARALHPKLMAIAVTGYSGRHTLSEALTAGASAPECLVEEVVKFLADKGFANVQELEVMPENVRFGLPPEIVEAIAAAPASVTAD